MPAVVSVGWNRLLGTAPGATRARCREWHIPAASRSHATPRR